MGTVTATDSDGDSLTSYVVTARASDGKHADGNVEQTATIDDTNTVLINVTNVDEAADRPITARFSSVPTTHDRFAQFQAHI